MDDGFPAGGSRRDMLARSFRAVSHTAADMAIEKLRNAEGIWGEKFVPDEHQPHQLDDSLGLGGTGAGYGQYDRPYFRPPGAVPEAEFLDMCSRCRACVDSCPEYCIVPAQAHMNAPVGTPIMFPNEAACTLCGYCMDICPSGALLPVPAEFVRIGLAHISEQTCVAYGEEHCTLCHDACPTQPNSISFSPDYFGTSPVVNPDLCTGCGLCVRPCPTAPKSIEVRLRPVELQDGAWDEDERIGASA